MKQHEAVIQTLERLGGQATLAELYREVMQVKNCTWRTQTPFASIRRIVQTRPEIFKVRPGLWALRSYQGKLGLSEHQESGSPSAETIQQSHAYYQGLLVTIGNLQGFSTFVPQQDKNRLCVNRPLRDLRTLQEIPRFSHEAIVKRGATVDVIWFNGRQMPNSLYEMELCAAMPSANSTRVLFWWWTGHRNGKSVFAATMRAVRTRKPGRDRSPPCLTNTPAKGQSPFGALWPNANLEP